MLLGLCVLSSVINAQYPPKTNVAKEELIKIHKNNYYSEDKIFAILVFLTALDSGIDFDVAVRMGLEQLRPISGA